MLEGSQTERKIHIDKDVFVNKVIVKEPTSFHTHDFIEIAYVSSGKGIHRLGKCEYSCTKGDICIIDYEVPHQFIPDENDNMTIYNCIFKPEFFQYSLNRSYSFSDITNHFLLRSFMTEDFKGYWNVSMGEKYNDSISEIYNKMLLECITQEEGYFEILRAYVIELLVTIFRFIKRSGKYSFKTAEIKNGFIERVIRHIESNFNKELAVNELAVLAFLSPSHFCRQFRDCMGITVKEFIQKTRIEEACSLLTCSNKKVVDIANEVGYHDLKHFNSVFKRFTGKTPSEFKKNFRMNEVNVNIESLK